MSEPQRLLQEGDDLTRSLLRSAQDDAPSPHARQKTMIALGLATGVGATVTAAAATSTASTLAKTSATAGLLKWIGMGVLGGVVTIGAVEVAQTRSEAAKAQTVHVDQTKAPIAPITAAVRPQAPQRAEAPAEAPSAEPAAIADSPAEKPVEAPKPTSRSAAEKPSLADEIAAIDAARVAIGAGDGAGALRALDDHDRRFPGGALGQEATVLRIQALVLRGDRATATRLGRAFLDGHPNSALAPRVRSLIGETTTP